MLKPDWKCVFTYVQSFYRRFRHGREPPIPTKTLTLTPPTAPYNSTTHVKTIEVREVKETISEHHKKTTYYFQPHEFNADKKQTLMQKYLINEDEPSYCSSTSSSSSNSTSKNSKVKVKKTKAVAFASAPAPTDDAPLPNNNVTFTNALLPSAQPKAEAIAFASDPSPSDAPPNGAPFSALPSAPPSPSTPPSTAKDLDTPWIIP